MEDKRFPAFNRRILDTERDNFYLKHCCIILQKQVDTLNDKVAQLEKVLETRTTSSTETTTERVDTDRLSASAAASHQTVNNQ